MERKQDFLSRGYRGLPSLEDERTAEFPFKRMEQKQDFLLKRRIGEQCFFPLVLDGSRASSPEDERRAGFAPKRMRGEQVLLPRG